MSPEIQDLVNKKTLEHRDIVRLLQATTEESKILFKHSEMVKANHIGKYTYFRGLIEFSNICTKNCLYCGIRAGNKNTNRYQINREAILQAAEFAHKKHYGSIVLQSGERDNPEFVTFIDDLLRDIKKLSNNELGITLSIGEQSIDTYKRWFSSGAHRYLLRIESSNKELYYKIHPNNQKHNFERRLQALTDLQESGYQTGTGVMIGLPFQTYDDLAGDLLFFRDFDIDMVGMGPYIEHTETPLYEFRNRLLPLKERFDLSLKMIAILRIMMPDINIAAATALQAIDPVGREKAVKIGANVVMPNITPTINRADYQLYENKPCTNEGADECVDCLEARIAMAGDEIGYGQWGDSKHFAKRKGNKV